MLKVIIILIAIVAIIIITALITGIALILKLKNKGGNNIKEKESELKDQLYIRTLMTKNELEFYKELKEITPENHNITCKCRVEDIIGVKKFKGMQAIRNKIKSRHIDFVIFDEKSGEISYAIELDDKTHEKRKDDDEFKNEIFKAVKLDLIRIKAKEKYNKKEISEEINSYQ